MDVALDHERCYRAVASRDARFDGSFYTAVRTTGIYCRPSCPAITPKRGNVTFFRTAAAAQRDGFRACRRCRPDAVPGSPEWNVRGDVVARSMRLVADGAIERVGVDRGRRGARLQRATPEPARDRGARCGAAGDRPHATGAHGADPAGDHRPARQRGGLGGGVRQHPVVQRHDRGRVRGVAHGAAGATPPRDRRQPRRSGGAADRALVSRRAGRGTSPTRRSGCAWRPASRSTPPRCWPSSAIARSLGLEDWDGRTYRRTLALPHGHATVACQATVGGLLAEFRLADLRDLAPGVARVRRLFDLDADPLAIAEVLGRRSDARARS